MDESGRINGLPMPPGRRRLPDAARRREDLLEAVRAQARRRWPLALVSRRWASPLAAAAVVAVVAVLMAIVVPQVIHGRGRGGTAPTACTSLVRGVTTGSAAIGVGYRPPRFALSSGDPSDLGQAGTVTYDRPGGPGGPAQLQINLSNYPAGLGTVRTGYGKPTSITIGGRPGLLSRYPASVGVYYKPTARFLIGVVGHNVPATTIIKVARNLSFRPPAIIELPVGAGHVMTKAAALAIARRSASVPAGPAAVKLSSWTEILAMMRASGFGHGIFVVPPVMNASPWRPVWAVLLAPPGHGLFTQRADLVVIVAAGGQRLRIGPGNHPSWFRVLSDRNPGLRGCPGGTSTRLPFGVLTRNEAAYVVRGGTAQPLGSARGETTTYVLKLTTVAALSRADPGLYGGCVRQDCALNELIWPTIAVTRTVPRHTLTCPPASVSVPSTYRPKQVREMFSVSVPDNSEVGCGKLPAWVARLKDLAPAH